MDRLWTPWRYSYITSASPGEGCVFCHAHGEGDDEANLIVQRGRLNYILLNLYPYNSGHLMIAPYAHVAALEECPAEASSEMFEMAVRCEGILRREYRAQGINLGMNIGSAAGAGVAGHIHMHVVPRWAGDANFMTVAGETRVLPEDLKTTWRRMREAFAG
jgi:ATP adenylyltransferase